MQRLTNDGSAEDTLAGERDAAAHGRRAAFGTDPLEVGAVGGGAAGDGAVQIGNAEDGGGAALGDAVQEAGRADGGTGVEGGGGGHGDRGEKGGDDGELHFEGGLVWLVVVVVEVGMKGLLSVE